MLKLKRLKIEKYRSVKPGTELHFRDSLNVLLGRNGTGKTTFLNLVVQLLNWNFSSFQAEPVELEYELQIERGRLVVRVRSELIRESPESIDFVTHGSFGAEDDIQLMLAGSRYSVSLDVDVSLDDQERESLRLEGSMLTLADEKNSILKQVAVSSVLVGSKTLTSIVRELSKTENAFGSSRMKWLRRVSAGQAAFLRRFDESLGYLDFVTRSLEFEVFRFTNTSSGTFDYASRFSEGSAVAGDQLVAELSSNPDADNVEVKSGEGGVPFLNQLVKLLDCQSVRLQLQRSSRTSGPMGKVVFGNMRFELIRRDGALVNHTLLSYGQKRLLAFYYYLATDSNAVVADELVNGMHHEWIEACLEDLGDRQSFLTSQNPLLLDYLAFESVEEVQDSFVLCRTDLHEGQEQWVWENMSDADADGFFKAYRVAIQHVSELLRTRGLW